MSSLETSGNVLGFATHLAHRMGASLEFVHVIDATKKEVSLSLRQERREAWSNELRERGVPVSWTVVHGRADEAIAARAAESKSSLILFELHRGGRRMIDCSDGVVSATIRKAHCPVMTVPAQFSGA